MQGQERLLAQQHHTPSTVDLCEGEGTAKGEAGVQIQGKAVKWQEGHTRQG